MEATDAQNEHQCTLRSEASEAFRAREWTTAHGIYQQILQENPDDCSALLNKCLTSLKLGEFETALQDANKALTLLRDVDGPVDVMLLAKAHHRKGQALLSLGRWQKGIDALRQGLAGCWGDGRGQLCKSLASPTGLLTVDLLTQHWAQLISDAEAPIALSARDGKLLKRVSPEHRFGADDLRQCIGAMLLERPWQAHAGRELLLAAWAAGRAPGRAACGLIRGAVYLQRGALDVAMRDVKVALAYAPQKDGRCAWSAAHALHSAVLEAQVENTQAALAMQRAQELQPAAHQAEALERLMRRIPDAHAEALKAGGAAALQTLLADALEEAKPEFLKQRPKYYYYNQWMRGRLAAACPALPEPVVLKMLDMEAGELDLVLQYPQAAAAQAMELLEYYDASGAGALAAREPPQLTWEQVKALKGPGIVGLGMGGIAPGELPAAPPSVKALPPPPPVQTLEARLGPAVDAVAA